MITSNPIMPMPTPPQIAGSKVPVPPKANNKHTVAYESLLRGEYTKLQLGVLFGVSSLVLNKMIGVTQPVNPLDAVLLHRWFIGDVATLKDHREDAIYTKPSDLLNLAKVKVAKQDLRKKKLENDIAHGQVIPVEDVEKTFAQAAKVISRWITLLPELFEKKSYIQKEKVGEFVVVIERMKKTLYDNLNLEDES